MNVNDSNIYIHRIIVGRDRRCKPWHQEKEEAEVEMKGAVPDYQPQDFKQRLL